MKPTDLRLEIFAYSMQLILLMGASSSTFARGESLELVNNKSVTPTTEIIASKVDPLSKQNATTVPLSRRTDVVSPVDSQSIYCEKLRQSEGGYDDLYYSTLDQVCEHSTTIDDYGNNTSPVGQSPDYEADTGGSLRLFDLFEPDEGNYTGTSASLLNAYLLSYASMATYDSRDDRSEDFGVFLENKMSMQGMDSAQFFQNIVAGTEGIVMANDSVVIVAFRGTYSDNKFLDHTDKLTDISIPMVRAPGAWGDDVYVHMGDYNAMDAIYDDMLPLIESHVSEGKRLWVTGHSLGGAIATLFAYQLHYVENIDVEGVHTFGSPRVGDINFADAYDEIPAGPNWASTVALADVTTRWVVFGDTVATLWDGGHSVESCTVTFFSFSLETPCLVDHDYYHVGILNMITPNSGGTGYEFQFDLAEDTNDINFGGYYLGLKNEHVYYEAALFQEIEDELKEQFN